MQTPFPVWDIHFQSHDEATCHQMAAVLAFFADNLVPLQLDARGVQNQDFMYPYLVIDSPADASHEALVQVPDPCHSCR